MNDYVLTFVKAILEQDTKQELNVVVVASIVEKCHCGNGYFSWDGILDRLAKIVGNKRAIEILSGC